MAESAVASALLGISKLLIQEAQFLGALPDKVEQLQTEMKRIQCFLRDADKRQDESDERVRGWVSEIRELAYEAEDVVATFIAEAALRGEKGFFRQFKRYVCFCFEIANRHNLGEKIDAIIDKIANLKSSLETYGIKINDQQQGECSSSSHPLKQLRRAYSFSIEDETVGLVDDMKVLLEQLIGDEHKHHRKVVISICGMGGLGKTTLARKLYHHDKVKCHFDAFAWIFVSQTFKAREILEATLIKLTSASTEQKKKISEMKDEEVAKALFQFQQKKRCLVILDDIWSKDDWNVLKHAFPIEKMVGVIVLTTRSKPLGLHVHPSCFIHESQSLSEEDSWDLFRKKAFLGRDYQDITNMEILGLKMVKKCSGLPLAITGLGGILATKVSLNEWNLAHKNIGVYLGKGGSKEYSNVEAILALSYSELPYHLKPCVLHLSQFPEDYSIPTKMLFRLWMAEGIVVNPLNEEETLEDVAEGYLRELIDRCLVLKGQIGTSGKIKSCRMHDLIRELSLSKANQENYLEIVDADAKTRYSKAHRVVVYATTNIVIDFEKRSHVRSLLGPLDLKSLRISDFNMLRVLSLKDCVTPKKRINEIGKLIHLKYLSLDNCGIQYLPLSLGNLRYLQTFFFKTNRGQGKLIIPKGIWNFQELRHLEIFCQVWSNINLGNLRNLQTLRTIGFVYVEGLEKLPNLQNITTSLERNGLLKLVQSEYLNGLSTLQIDVRLSVNMLYESDALRKLLLSCSQLKKLVLEGKIEKLPDYHQNFTPNLTKLKLRFSYLVEDPMPVLEKLSKLTFLDLSSKAFWGEKMVCSSKGFPRLKTLFLMNLPKLVEWQVDEGSMASLCHLRIEKCRKLKMVPEGIKYINTLSQLEITEMPGEFCNRVKVKDGKKGEDYYKVRHDILSQLGVIEMPDEFKNRVKVKDGEEGEDYYKVRHDTLSKLERTKMPFNDEEEGQEYYKVRHDTLSQLERTKMPFNGVKVKDGEEGEDYYKVRHVPYITFQRDFDWKCFW